MVQHKTGRTVPKFDMAAAVIFLLRNSPYLSEMTADLDEILFTGMQSKTAYSNGKRRQCPLHTDVIGHQRNERKWGKERKEKVSEKTS